MLNFILRSDYQPILFIEEKLFIEEEKLKEQLWVGLEIEFLHV